MVVIISDTHCRDFSVKRQAFLLKPGRKLWIKSYQNPTRDCRIPRDPTGRAQTQSDMIATRPPRRRLRFSCFRQSRSIAGGMGMMGSSISAFAALQRFDIQSIAVRAAPRRHLLFDHIVPCSGSAVHTGRPRHLRAELPESSSAKPFMVRKISGTLSLSLSLASRL